MIRLHTRPCLRERRYGQWKASSCSEAIRRGLQGDGTVLLVETADCCGGGAAGDSVATLKTLLQANPQPVALVPVVDPIAATECHAAGIGSFVTVRLGHNVDPKWGRPVEVTAE